MSDRISRTGDFPYQLTTGCEQHWEATNWCEQQFGPRWSAVSNRSGEWCVFWGGVDSPRNYHWYFLNEQDVTMFVLRWS